MRLNKALLRKVAAKLRRLRHEEHYDQGRWMAATSCGTAACIAGHIALEAGYRPLTKTMLREFASEEGGPLDEDALYEASFFCHKAGERSEVGEVAANASGIDEDSWLFDADPDSAWPDPFAEQWEHAMLQVEGHRRPSRIAADLLDAIADGKVEL